MFRPKRRDATFPKVFGQNLARQRQAAGIGQEELGFRADIHRTAIGQIERGATIPRADTLLRLCGALDVGAEDLFHGLVWTPPEYTSGHLRALLGELGEEAMQEAP